MTINRSIAWCCLVLAFSLPAAAQFQSTAHNAQSAAMGGCLFVLGNSHERMLTFSYRQDYALAGWADKQISLLWPNRNRGTWIALYHHFGDAAYNEQQATVGYGLQVSEMVHVGVAGQYNRLAVDDEWYETQQWLSATVFTRIKPINSLELCLTGSYLPWQENRPWGMRVGATYRTSPAVLTAIEAEYQQRFRIHYGMEYCYRNNYFLRAGFATNPTVLTFGVGIKVNQYRFDLSAESHSTLGITPQLSFALCF